MVLTALVYIHKNKHTVNFSSSAIFWLLTGLTAARVASGFFGVDPARSFWGVEQRMDGNLGFLALYGWFLCLLIFLDGRAAWDKFFKIFVAVSFVSGIFSLVQYWFPAEWGFLAGGVGVTPFWQYRLIGTMGNPIFFAGLLLPNVFISAAFAIFAETKKKKVLWRLAAAFFAVLVYMTHTRGALVALAAGVAVLAAAELCWRFGHRVRVWMIGAAGAVIAGGVFAVIKFDLLARFFGVWISSPTAQTRLLLWKITLRGIADKWLFGWGPENFVYAFSKFYDPMLLKYSFYETWADKPHNGLLETALTGGIIGFVLLIVLIATAGVLLSRLAKKNSACRAEYFLFGAIIAAYLTHIFFSFEILEMRMALFAVLAFIVFCRQCEFGGAKISFSLARGLLIVAAAAILLPIMRYGFASVSAAGYASSASENLVLNDFWKGRGYFEKLAAVKTPYAADNWELMADVVLKVDAMGSTPRVVLVQIIPIVMKGLEQAAATHADNFSYHYRLAQIYGLAGQYVNGGYLDKAVFEALKAKNISPRRQLADLYLAQVYYFQRKPEAAQKALEDLVAANPDLAEPYWFLGLFSEAGGASDKAYAYLSTAYDKGYRPKIGSESLLYIDVLSRYKDYGRLGPLYDQVLTQMKDNPKLWAAAAAVYLELKQYDKARSAARQAIFLDGSYGDEGENFIKKVDLAQWGK